MKRKLLLAVFLGLLCVEAFAVKHSLVEKDKIKFHNFSSNTFDASNMKMSINNQWHDLAALSLISGTLIVPAGGDVVLGGFTIPLFPGSVALWYGSVDPNNPSAFDMASFVQFGSAGHPFESLAAQVGLWATGTFVHGVPTLTRDNDWSSDGASHWTGTILSVKERSLRELLEIGPVPFHDELRISTQGYTMEYEYQLINVLGSVITAEEGIKQEELIVNTALLEEGVYFLRITDSHGISFTKRLVKR